MVPPPVRRGGGGNRWGLGFTARRAVCSQKPGPCTLWYMKHTEFARASSRAQAPVLVGFDLQNGPDAPLSSSFSPSPRFGVFRAWVPGSVVGQGGSKNDRKMLFLPFCCTPKTGKTFETPAMLTGLGAGAPSRAHSRGSLWGKTFWQFWGIEWHYFATPGP